MSLAAAMRSLFLTKEQTRMKYEDDPNDNIHHIQPSQHGNSQCYSLVFLQAGENAEVPLQTLGLNC